MPDYCTVEYDGRGVAAEHLRAGFMLRERMFATGKRVEIDSDEAGLLVRSAPRGSVKVHTGEPTHTPIRSHRADEQQLRTERLLEVFPKDPARLLQATSPLSREVLDGLGGKAGIAFVESGKADGCLFDAAHWAWLGGLAEVAKAAVRRADALNRKR